jgi:hypothetical protein
MPTAQERFLTIVREQIAPGLRAVGFRGSGSVYTLPDDGVWRLLGFQRSRSSDRRRVQFTINLTVADRVGWEAARQVEPWLGARPSGNGKYLLAPDVFRFTRIGPLMPNHQDLWWDVHAGEAGGRMAEEVLSVIKTYGIPWLREGPSSVG